MEKKITMKAFNRWLAMLILLITGTVQGMAQDVQVDLESGNLVSAVTDANETGFALGLSSLWRHEQLALSLTATDRDAISESGEISFPSAVLGKNNGKMIIIGGRRPSFLVLSLPKGYRITRYELILENDLVGANLGGNFRCLNTNSQSGNNPPSAGSGSGTMRFYETKPWRNNETNSGNSQRAGSDAGGYNATQVKYIELGADWQNGQIGTTAEEVLATAKAADGDIDINTTEEDSGKEYKITRISTPENPMGNQIYFRLVKDYYFYGLSIKKFVVHFTAEGTFGDPLKPSGADHARRVVMSPFKTNKIDIGKLEPRTQPGTNNTYFSYQYEEVEDLTAYNYIYQARAVDGGAPFELESDEEGDITPHITPVSINGQNLFAFGNDTYFVEPPVSVHTSSGLEAPIGYRVVGAKFECLWADASNGVTYSLPQACQIYYQSNNGRYYYLNSTDLTQLIRTERYQIGSVYTWQVDDDGNIFFEDTAGKHYLACNGTGDTRGLSLSTAATGNNARFNLHFDPDDNNRIYYLSDGGNKYYLQYNNENNVFVTRNPTNNGYLPGHVTQNHNVVYGAFSPGAYTLKVYDKEGEIVNPDNIRTISSSEDANAAEPIVLEGLNNDAVKFSIEGLTDGKQALVQVTLQLQALNPYINSMEIKCINLPRELQMSQTFTASNFKVSGGEFIFYVPSELKGETMTISFSDLYSNYGDKTYWNQALSLTNSRYSFVTSDYFNPINGYGNKGLYADAYDPDAGFESKVITSTAGNVRFKFNNAENLGANQTGEAFLEEYPFSVEKYLSNYPDPDAKNGETPTIAAFNPCTVIAGEGEQEAGSFFVFTADETRYNIAPTDEWQHRSYAFYRMDVKAIAKSYEPELKWTKIYDKSLYSNDDKEDAQFGLELGTGTGVVGYLTVKQILESIDAAIAAEVATPTGNVPTSKDQILYIDGSKLLAIYNYTKSETDNTVTLTTLEDLKEGLGANALIFLPLNATTQLDNFAYKTSTGTFLAGNDIKLTDKQPFYTPYDIHLEEENFVTYTRELTRPDYGQAVNATVMLPFTLGLVGGKHTNSDGKCSFTVNAMETGAQMATIEGSGVNYGTAYFKQLSTAVTEANKPYMIKVESIDESVSENNTISFIASQKGSTIVKTPEPTSTPAVFSGKLITGETAQAKYKDVNYYFTNYASYSGGKFDRAVSEDVFYFSKNKYVDLHTLYPGNLQYLKSYPFRGVYTYSISAPTTPSGAKLMKGFYISYNLDEMEDAGIITQLEQLGTKADMMIRSGKGFITITATADQMFTIRSISGMTIKNVNVSSGNTTTVSLPAGIYIVNNTKITVK